MKASSWMSFQGRSKIPSSSGWFQALLRSAITICIQQGRLLLFTLPLGEGSSAGPSMQVLLFSVANFNYRSPERKHVVELYFYLLLPNLYVQGAERCRWVMWIDEPWRPVLSCSIMRLWDESDDRATILQSKIKKLQQAYIELWTERSNFAAEHERVVSQLTDIIGDNKIKMASRLDLHTKLCLASATVVVTLASVLAYVLSS
ncbi:hypothetical protein ZWY2020_051684 [Hordeum vulgare]|nr:hypothetical protein ZWY2020_051684 [Hordeum vulgare]